MPTHDHRLADDLAALPAATPRVTLTFGELQMLLGRPLPASAWGRRWWATRGWATVTRTWPVTGWRVGAVSVSGGREAVTFVRTAATPQAHERSSTR
jgi:hypothetical protein